MKPSDYFGFAAALSFGLWWLAFPRTVIVLYTWFHRGRVAMPPTSGVRIAGALWLALVVVVAFIFSRTRA